MLLIRLLIALVWVLFVLKVDLDYKSLLRVRLDRTYFAEKKTENWKHCSKINFKCVNSVVRLIFNEKVAEKWSCVTREQCTNALFMGE